MTRPQATSGVTLVSALLGSLSLIAVLFAAMSLASVYRRSPVRSAIQAGRQIASAALVTNCEQFLLGKRVDIPPPGQTARSVRIPEIDQWSRTYGGGSLIAEFEIRNPPFSLGSIGPGFYSAEIHMTSSDGQYSSVVSVGVKGRQVGNQFEVEFCSGGTFDKMCGETANSLNEAFDDFGNGPGQLPLEHDGLRRFGYCVSGQVMRNRYCTISQLAGAQLLIAAKSALGTSNTDPSNILFYSRINGNSSWFPDNCYQQYRSCLELNPLTQRPNPCPVNPI